MFRAIFRSRRSRREARQEKRRIYDDVSIADLGEHSIMEEDPSVRQLLAEQMQILPDPAAIPARSRPAPSMALAVPRAAPGRQLPRRTRCRTDACRIFAASRCATRWKPQSADGIEVTVEGSGVARAQMPLPGTSAASGRQNPDRFYALIMTMSEVLAGYTVAVGATAGPRSH